MEVSEGKVEVICLYRCMYLGFMRTAYKINQPTVLVGTRRRSSPRTSGWFAFSLSIVGPRRKYPTSPREVCTPRLSLSSPLSQAAPFWRRAGAQPARGVGARAVIHTPRMILHKQVNTAQGGGPRSFRWPFVPKSARSNAARLFERVERPPPHHRPQSDMEHLGEAGEP